MINSNEMVRIYSLIPRIAIDFRSLALFRIALGLIWFTDLLHRFGQASAHYSDDGVLPLSMAKTLYPLSSFSTIWLWQGSETFAQIFIALSAVVALLFAAGVQTKFTSIANWFLCIALQSRNEMVLCGADHMIRELFFISIFLPIDRKFSPTSKKGGPTGSASIWTAAALLQVIYFYFFSALWKSGGEWRTEGTALYYAFSYAPFATAASKYILGLPILLKAATFLTFGLELLSPFILLLTRDRLRVAGFFTFFILHLGIAITMRLGPIPFVNMAALLIFLPAHFWRSPEKIELNFSTPSVLFGSVAILYVLTWNTISLTDNRSFAKWKIPGYALRLDQEWSFFAPFPFKSSGWWAFPATTVSGDLVNAWTGGPVMVNKPQNYFSLYGGTHWVAYLILSLEVSSKPNNDLLLAFLCKRNPNIARVAFDYYEEPTTLDSAPPRVQHYRLAEKNCIR